MQKEPDYLYSVYLLRDPTGAVRRVLRAHLPETAERRRPAGWRLQLVYTTRSKAHAVTKQKMLGRHHQLRNIGSGRWPKGVASPTSEELWEAELGLGLFGTSPDEVIDAIDRHRSKA